MFWIDLLDKIFRIVSVVGIAAVVAAAVGHYLLFGPRHPELARDKRDLRRFSLGERFIHAATILSFLTLAVTGFVATIYLRKPLSGWLWVVHLVAAPVFAVGLAAIALRWAEDCRLESYDWEWAKQFGGYLGSDKDVPAGRFNGGQKGFFWAIILLGLVSILSGLVRMFPVFSANIQEISYQAHRYSCLFLVMAVIAHIYLGTLANPGTWRVIISGYVSSRWAKHHHPIWWERRSSSTLGLIITGVPLWCLGRIEYGWSQDVVSFFGSIEIIRLVHRFCGVVLVLVSVYHLLYTFLIREGRREFIELLPRLKDVADVTKNSLYFLGLSRQRPRFGRYTYYEKFDYWAVYWGCVIMIGTGLTLWFPGVAAKVVPWLTYELSAEVHADEAVLATLALLVWHFYNVHFNPSRFPGTLLWWHGRISHEEILCDHPLEYEKLVSGKGQTAKPD